MFLPHLHEEFGKSSIMVHSYSAYVEKREIPAVTKISVFVKSTLYSLVTLLSRNFCQKRVRQNCSNFHTGVVITKICFRIFGKKFVEKRFYQQVDLILENTYTYNIVDI